MRLGAITNGISQDLEQALQVMQRDQIPNAELQFIWDLEICHHSDAQNQQIQALLDKYGIRAYCIMKHVFAPLSVADTTAGTPAYREQLDLLRKSIVLARFFGADITRVQPFQKQNVIFGEGGAEHYLSGGNKSWSQMLRLLEPACQIAEEEGIDVMMETGTGSYLHTASLAVKAIRDLGSKRLKLLWDPANCLYSMEHPLRAYELARDYIVDVHIKDIRVDKPMAKAVYCPLGHGEMAQYLDDLADALRMDGYQGIVTFENQVIPTGKTMLEGWDQSIQLFREIFS